MNGIVEKKGFVKTGLLPNYFNISTNGKFLLCSCRESNTIQVFEIEQKSGDLKYLNKDINIFKPECIQFLLN